MGLAAVGETTNLIRMKQAVLSEPEKEFVLHFAFSTGDKELTNKLIDELIEEDADKKSILQKYSTMAGFQSDWIRRIENLLVALEMYRIQEEKAMKTLTELLTSYGVELTVDEMKEMSVDKVRKRLEEKGILMR